MNSPTLILTLLLALASRIPAQITADMVVSQDGTEMGTITIEFDHVAAPMATANFIGLAEGKFPWIDSATGVVQHNKPYYDGLTFHRVIDGFMNQGGSQNGIGNDSPGYTFQDGTEVTNGLDHSLPYRISMANSGLNTNGSQFFLTVGPATWLDGKHIVFGKIKETGPSRDVVDAINAVAVIDADGPDNDINTQTDNNNRPVIPVLIDSVTVNIPDDIDFDPCAQGLPAVSTPPLAAPITPAATTLDFVQPAGSTFHLAYSDDLADWSTSSPRTLDIDDTPLSSFTLPAAATGGGRRFYSPALVTYDPEFYFPTSLANKTFTVNLNPTTQVIFEFDETGESAFFTFGTETDTRTTLYSAYTHSHYGGYIYLEVPFFVNRYWEFNDLNMTAANATEVSGTVVISIRNLPFSAPAANFLGTFTLTK